MKSKEYFKTLDKVSFGSDRTKLNRELFYHFYFNYFYNIIINYFTWENLPDGIDENFIEKKLLETGSLAVFHDDRFGLVFQSGVFTDNFNIYDRQLGYKPVNTSSIQFPTLDIIYSHDEYITYEAFRKEQESDQSGAVIIPNNNQYTGYLSVISLFCEKLADIEMTIQLNRNAQVTPFIVLADDKNILSLNNIFNKIQSFDPVVKIKTQTNKAGEIADRQLTDFLQVYRTDAPYLLDKLHDEKNRVISQLLTFIGINNNPIDKKERLVTAEALSNNGLISANIEVNWKARRNAVDLINQCFGTNITVEPAKYIQQFNLEMVQAELSTREEPEDDTGERDGDD